MQSSQVRAAAGSAPRAVRPSWAAARTAARACLNGVEQGHAELLGGRGRVGRVGRGGATGQTSPGARGRCGWWSTSVERPARRGEHVVGPPGGQHQRARRPGSATSRREPSSGRGRGAERGQHEDRLRGHRRGQHGRRQQRRDAHDGQREGGTDRCEEVGERSGSWLDSATPAGSGQRSSWAPRSIRPTTGRRTTRRAGRRTPSAARQRRGTAPPRSTAGEDGSEAEVLGRRVDEAAEADDAVARGRRRRPAGEVAGADEEVVAQVGAAARRRGRRRCRTCAG